MSDRYVMLQSGLMHSLMVLESHHSVFADGRVIQGLKNGTNSGIHYKLQLR